MKSRFLVWLMASVAALLVNNAVFAGFVPEKETFSLPVNHLNSTKINLIIYPPQGFSQINSGNNAIIELIPQAETPDNRSQIITLQKIAGKQQDAADFLSSLKKMFMQNAKNVTILEETTVNGKDYQTATLAISYFYEGRHEVVYMKYFSGPTDLSGIQFARVIPSADFAPQTVDDIKYKLKKILKVVEK